MKTTKAFIICLYISLGLNYLAVALCGRAFVNGSEAWLKGMLILFLISGVVLFIANVLGCMVAVLSARVDDMALLKAVKQMKLYTIPFYLLNFVFQFIVWTILMMALRGMLFFLLWIPFFSAWLLILESGCVANRYIKRLRARMPDERKPGKVHYFLQLIPVLDVLSTLIVLKKYGEVTVQEV